MVMYRRPQLQPAHADVFEWRNANARLMVNHPKCLTDTFGTDHYFTDALIFSFHSPDRAEEIP